jgi:hypothetical protein
MRNMRVLEHVAGRPVHTVRKMRDRNHRIEQAAAWPGSVMTWIGRRD